MHPFALCSTFIVGILLSFAEMGADRGQLQATARGQQLVPGQPHSQDRGPERGGVRPRPVSAVEVLTEPAAVGAPAGHPVPAPAAESHGHGIGYVS